MPTPAARKVLRPFYRAAIEIGFIIFLFYANLLMGEFTRSSDHGHTLQFAVADILTAKNFVIAVVAAIFGHAVFEFLRRNV